MTKGTCAKCIRADIPLCHQPRDGNLAERDSGREPNRERRARLEELTASYLARARALGASDADIRAALGVLEGLDGLGD